MKPERERESFKQTVKWDDLSSMAVEYVFSHHCPPKKIPILFSTKSVSSASAQPKPVHTYPSLHGKQYTTKQVSKEGNKRRSLERVFGHLIPDQKDGPKSRAPPREKSKPHP